MSPTRFIGLVGSCAVPAFLLLFAVTGIAAISLPPAIGAAFIPFLFHDRRRRRRHRETVAAWPDGIRDIVASLQSGMSLPRSVERLAESGPTALREAFEGYPAMARAVGTAPALDAVRERLADPISDRVIEVLRLAYERGGSAVPGVLTELADATTSDLWAAEQLRSEVLEQKINARAVFVLPWLVLVFLCATPGDFRDFYSSGGGAVVIGLGGLVSGLGVFIAERLGRDAIEERVLGGWA
jgi:tight adherence protein B